MFALALVILALAIAAFVVVTTALPLIRTGYWVTRMCDFPRVQIGTIALIGLALALVSLPLGADPAYAWPAAGACVVAAIAQAIQIVRYTRLWPRQLGPGHEDSTVVRLLTSNIDYENDSYDAVRTAIEEVRAEVLLLVELNEPWEQALRTLIDDYPHRAGCVRGDGLGLTLLSRHELRNIEVRHLVSDRRASIHGEIVVPGAGPVKFVAVHPTPPGLDEEGYDGRRNSRPRDAELMMVAEEIRDHPRHHWIVFGDFNDVAWSHTTRLFRRLSGMQDPRIGFKLLNTFHARYRLLRYPLDHIFLSPRLGIRRLERVRLPGSDHFGVLAEIAVPPDEPENNLEHADADGADREEAAEIVQEGDEAEREEREA